MSVTFLPVQMFDRFPLFFPRYCLNFQLNRIQSITEGAKDYPEGDSPLLHKLS
jgi:hypothetical protein